MPSPPKYHVDFIEHGIYHVFNRTNNRELLFRSEENYRFFLKKFDEYLSPYLDTFAWCLLPNHFHVLIRVKSTQVIKDLIAAIEIPTISEKKFASGVISVNQIIETTFKRFFQSYALAFNKMFDRKGNLFYKTFKRTEVNKEQHFTQAILYIHANPIKHKLATTYDTWKWSSWHTYSSSKPSRLLRQEVFDWFGGSEAFIKAHRDAVDSFLLASGRKPLS